MKQHHNISLTTISWLSVLLICYVFSFPNSAEANTSLSASPLIQTFSLSNATQSANLSISNNSDHSIVVSLNLLPFKQSLDGGASPVLGSNKDILTSSYLKHITVTLNGHAISFFSLPAHSNQILKVNIPPQLISLHARDYYFCILFSTNNISPVPNISSKTQIDAYLTQNLTFGSLFLLSPKIKSLTSFHAPIIKKSDQQSIIYDSYLKGTINLNNSNNTYQNVSIAISRKNIFGTVIQTTQLPQAFILANGSRALSYSINMHNDIGPENVTINVKDIHSGKSFTYTQLVFLLPLRLMLYIAILVFFLAYIVFKIKTRLKDLH